MIGIWNWIYQTTQSSTVITWILSSSLDIVSHMLYIVYRILSGNLEAAELRKLQLIGYCTKYCMICMASIWPIGYYIVLAVDKVCD